MLSANNVLSVYIFNNLVTNSGDKFIVSTLFYLKLDNQSGKYRCGIIHFKSFNFPNL